MMTWTWKPWSMSGDTCDSMGRGLHFLSGLETSRDLRPWCLMGSGEWGWKSLEMLTKENSNDEDSSKLTEIQ